MENNINNIAHTRWKKSARVKIHKNIPLGNKWFRLNANKIYVIFLHDIRFIAKQY